MDYENEVFKMTQPWNFFVRRRMLGNRKKQTIVLLTRPFELCRLPCGCTPVAVKTAAGLRMLAGVRNDGSYPLS